tara:strand:- start:8654 stop:9871 length:1218 start_codon:yes stop_codon:yes gene_type:complete
MPSSTNTTFGPLDNVTVIDLTQVVAGGSCTSHFADFGSNVIKVEHPSKGDIIRNWGPFNKGQSLWWAVIGRNKKSVTIDLSTPDGKELLLKLVKKADVLIESFRVGTMEKWGLGYEQLAKVNPKIIVAHITGYGQTGPYSKRKGFGSAAEAMSGFVNSNGYPNLPPLLPPMPLADEIAGTFATMSILMALLKQKTQREHKGQEIDISLYEPLFRLLIPNIIQYDQLGLLASRIGSRFADASPRGIFQSKDNQWLALSANSQGTWENLAKAIDPDTLIKDPRFTTNKLRVEHSEELEIIIQEWMTTKTSNEITQALESTGAVIFPVYTTPDILNDPHYINRGNISTIEHPILGPIKMPSPVPHFSSTPGRIQFSGPTLGQHNQEVFHDYLGISLDELEKLNKAGII